MSETRIVSSRGQVTLTDIAKVRPSLPIIAFDEHAAQWQAEQRADPARAQNGAHQTCRGARIHEYRDSTA